MAECVQLMDICCIDLLGNCSKSNNEEAVEFGTEPLIPVSKPMKFHWISSSLEPARMTSNIKFKPTITYDECPRDLDILLIGGPMPSHRPAAADKFMKEAYAKTKTVMTTCVGSWWLASSGVLDGQNVTINREALPMVKKLYPKIDWLDQRWVVDSKEGGELWTSGGAQAGEKTIMTFVPGSARVSANFFQL